MSRSIRRAAFVVFALTPSLAFAQWQVALETTMDPLPVGACAAIRLTLFDPVTKGVPRNQQGRLIQMADFDVVVTTADGVSATEQYLDAYNVSACGCQGAAPGTVVTVTATYPAKGLAAGARVPGVAFSKSTTFTLARPQGTVQPPPCVFRASAPNPTPAAAATLTVVAAAAAPPPPARASSAQAMTGSIQTVGDPIPLAAGRTPPAGEAQRAGAPARPLQNAPPGAAHPRQLLAAAPPTGVMISATPLVASLTWTAAPNAARYSVWRKDGPPVSVERSGPALTATAFVDTVPSALTTYVYTVIAHHSDGRSAEAPGVSFLTPPLINPTGFKATLMPDGKVQLQWDAMPGASRYLLSGPGLPNNGNIQQTATTQIAQLLPMGPLSWKVYALYPGNNTDYSNASVASAMVRKVPAHPVKWLSKNNGTGSLAQATAHSDLICPGGTNCFDKVTTKYPGKTAKQFLWWGDTQLRQEIGDPAEHYEAVYGNTEDLGVGRRTNCIAIQGLVSGPNGLTTVCYSTSHGPAPGEPGFGSAPVITRAALGVQTLLGSPQAWQYDPWGSQPRSATIIIKDNLGSIFLAMTTGTWDLNERRQATGLWWPTWVTPPQLLKSLVLDTEGQKFVPHSCIACHGGTYNAVTKRVDGASLLPLDPGSLVYANDVPGSASVSRGYQEENIRRINAIVVNSAPTSAVATYIRQLYGGNVSLPGTKAIDNFVPSGWSDQPGLYRQIVKPYCSSCHLAAPSNINFATWNNFLANKALIHSAVCTQRTMPHSEIAFKDFWTKDTGLLYLPGLLAAALGYPQC